MADCNGSRIERLNGDGPRAIKSPSTDPSHPPPTLSRPRLLRPSIVEGDIVPAFSPPAVSSPLFTSARLSPFDLDDRLRREMVLGRRELTKSGGLTRNDGCKAIDYP